MRNGDNSPQEGSSSSSAPLWRTDEAMAGEEERAGQGSSGMEQRANERVGFPPSGRRATSRSQPSVGGVVLNSDCHIRRIGRIRATGPLHCIPSFHLSIPLPSPIAARRSIWRPVKHLAACMFSLHTLVAVTVIQSATRDNMLRQFTVQRFLYRVQAAHTYSLINHDGPSTRSIRGNRGL